ncbi:hypothetical protein [Sulfurimonas marina]|uniref:Uncharacterized protein n=1 Tax=Sulfurimonas marina TaxID=2590551 RepID=A0A7M1AVU1_9BACT|nr:hypothetical protein [Sulfurimonas marina]QOP40708.1 hypothetical protein FJR03_02695 [Sulfurimonas marina]
MKKILVSTLFTAGMLFTQAQAQSVQKDSIKVEKTFKNSFDTQVLKDAFMDAASKESWRVTGDTPQKLSLEKNFSQKRKYYNHAVNRGQRRIIHETVNLNVSLAESGFSMNLTLKDKDSKIAEEAQQSLEDLQSKVYTNLVKTTL